MIGWHLNEHSETRFGRIAWGCAGSGPPLLLAHGWPWSSHAWHRMIPALTDRFTCYWYDMLGYGKSEMPADRPTSLDVQGELQAAMVSLWGIEPPTVFAHDFGGATSLRSHLLGKVEFKRLILMNVVAISPWGSEFFDHVGKHVHAFTGLPPHIHEAVVRAYIGGALVRAINEGDYEALVRPWLSDIGRVSFYRQFAQADEAFTDAIEPLFVNIRCPVDILWGTGDPWIPIERGRALHHAIPGSSFIELPKLGHLPQLEDPETVIRTLEKIGL